MNKFDLYLVDKAGSHYTTSFDTHEQACNALLVASKYLADQILEIRVQGVVITRVFNGVEKPLVNNEIYRAANILKSLGISLH